MSSSGAHPWVARARVLALPFLALGAWISAQAAPLPEPLTLEASLALADAPHPDTAAVAADNAARRADQLTLEALTGVPTRFAADDEADRLLILHARQHRRTKILRCYLGVLLADLAATESNEAMAIAYVRMDRARQRHALGQVSDIVLAELTSTYQSVLRKRAVAEAKQRARRSRLALALNRPGELPARLLPPRLPGNQAERPDLEPLQASALEQHTRLGALRLRLQAAEARLSAARKALAAADDDPVEKNSALSRSALLRAAVARHEAELARLRGRLDQVRLTVR